MEVCFSSAYLPPIAWFKALKHYSQVGIESQESWQKQSYRNRCYILGPNGAQMLNIPIVHNEQKDKLATVEISFAENWPNVHWQAIKTAYGNAPFFEVLAPELEEVYRRPATGLFDWNLHLIELCLHWLQMPRSLVPTTHWRESYRDDLRESFHPKRKQDIPTPPYPQVFDDVLPFTPGLSIIDLLMNEGPAAYDYL